MSTPNNLPTREAVARIVDPWAFEAFSTAPIFELASGRREALTKADQIDALYRAALSAPRGEVVEGLIDRLRSAQILREPHQQGANTEFAAVRTEDIRAILAMLSVSPAPPVGGSDSATDGSGEKAAEGTLQERVQPWMMACFGPEISADKLERNDRFIEEALELCQASGYPASRAHELVEYVYGRPQGDINQEVGGVMITLAAHCLAHGVDMHEAGETELARIWTKVDQIRAKQAAKPKGSALPIATPEPPAPSKGEEALDAARYRWLRDRDPGTLTAPVPPGLFIGRVPENVILTGAEADAAIDAALSNAPAGGVGEDMGAACAGVQPGHMARTETAGVAGGAAAQEAAFRLWWDNARDDEQDLLIQYAGLAYPERLAFRAGWLAALQTTPPPSVGAQGGA